MQLSYALETKTTAFSVNKSPLPSDRSPLLSDMSSPPPSFVLKSLYYDVLKLNYQ